MDTTGRNLTKIKCYMDFALLKKDHPDNCNVKTKSDSLRTPESAKSWVKPLSQATEELIWSLLMDFERLNKPTNAQKIHEGSKDTFVVFHENYYYIY